MNKAPEKIQFFHTCVVNDLFPEAGMAVVDVFRHIGIRVEVPTRQTCCGQPLFNAGFHTEARKAARHTIEILHETEGPIIIPSGSCTDMIKHHFPTLFQDDKHFSEVVSSVTGRCFEFTQFIVDELGITDLGAKLKARAAYHPSCHLLRGLGIRQQPLKLLEQIEGLEIVQFDEQEECCGFGGSFSTKNPGISGALLSKKLSNINAAEATMVVSCDLGCLMHLEGGIHRKGHSLRAQHIAEVISAGLKT